MFLQLFSIIVLLHIAVWLAETTALPAIGNMSFETSVIIAQLLITAVIAINITIPAPGPSIEAALSHLPGSWSGSWPSDGPWQSLAFSTHAFRKGLQPFLKWLESHIDPSLRPLLWFSVENLGTFLSGDAVQSPSTEPPTTPPSLLTSPAAQNEAPPSDENSAETESQPLPGHQALTVEPTPPAVNLNINTTTSGINANTCGGALVPSTPTQTVSASPAYPPHKVGNAGLLSFSLATGSPKADYNSGAAIVLSTPSHQVSAPISPHRPIKDVASSPETPSQKTFGQQPSTPVTVLRVVGASATVFRRVSGNSKARIIYTDKECPLVSNSAGTLTPESSPISSPLCCALCALPLGGVEGKDWVTPKEGQSCEGCPTPEQLADDAVGCEPRWFEGQSKEKPVCADSGSVVISAPSDDQLKQAAQEYVLGLATIDAGITALREMFEKRTHNLLLETQTISAPAAEVVKDTRLRLVARHDAGVSWNEAVEELEEPCGDSPDSCLGEEEKSPVSGEPESNGSTSPEVGGEDGWAADGHSCLEVVDGAKISAEGTWEDWEEGWEEDREYITSSMVYDAWLNSRPRIVVFGNHVLGFGYGGRPAPSYGPAIQWPEEEL